MISTLLVKIHGLPGVMQCLTRNYPQNQGGGACANLIDFNQDEETLYEENASRVSHIRSKLDAMTFTEKQQLAKELGQGEDQDFPAA
jgi:hypothetical protein